MRIVAICLGLWCHLPGTALQAEVTVYMSQPTPLSSPQPPADYLAAVAGRSMVRLDFDDPDHFPPGRQHGGATLQGVGFSTSAPAGLLVRRQVYGAPPASAPHALVVATPGPHELVLSFAQPVSAVGFVLHHQNVPATLTLQDIAGHALATRPVHFDGPSWQNRWIGVVADQDVISLLRYDPAGDEDYGLDNLEFGVLPAPGTLSALVLLCALAGTDRRRCAARRGMPPRPDAAGQPHQPTCCPSRPV
ncbi:MAG: hypothetical protein ACE5K7_06895 [Phycisphaerae bacterium]